jgi:hypothetical protein
MTGQPTSRARDDLMYQHSVTLSLCVLTWSRVSQSQQENTNDYFWVYQNSTRSKETHTERGHTHSSWKVACRYHTILQSTRPRRPSGHRSHTSERMALAHTLHCSLPKHKRNLYILIQGTHVGICLARGMHTDSETKKAGKYIVNILWPLA